MTCDEWLNAFHRLTPERREEVRAMGASLPRRPVISVLLPVYSPDLRLLDEAIASVRAQLYENWELCVADDASTNEEVRPFLERKTLEEKRIRVCLRETNGHISACSNSALALAKGEWCTLLDQDDLLAEEALAEVICEINRQPEAGLIYSDEDFIDSRGRRSNPFFKPDWNPELFLGQNYINHLGVYRTALLREIGGFREGFEGSQDYDLALRCVVRLRPEQIRHIPRLLYHWRMVSGSLADKPDAKPYARHAARRALNSYLHERAIAARAEACPENAESHRVIYVTPDPFPSVAVISNAPPRDWLPEFVIRAEPGARAANAAAKNARAEVLLFLSGEVVSAEEGWLEEIVSQVVRPKVGAVGGRLWSAEGKLEDGGLILGIGGIAEPAFRGLPRGHPGYFNRAWLQQNLSAVSGACLAVRREIFLRLGGFDEKNLPHHFYDIDFCLRLWAAGLQVVWTPYANLIFAGSGRREESDSPNEAAYLRKRWAGRLEADPFYNPNLSLDPPGFTLAIPPRL